MEQPSTSNRLYRRLDPQSKRFRLLTIQSGFWEEQISCRLTEHTLDEAPEYTALSYAWDDLTAINYPKTGQDEYYAACYRIFIWPGFSPEDGQESQQAQDLNNDGSLTFPVTANLYAALQRVRRTKFGRIWVDALCINQENSSERSHQVRFMREIYSKAACTLVWLGPGSPGSDSFLSAVEHVDLDSIQPGVTEIKVPPYFKDETIVHTIGGISLSDLAVFAAKVIRRSWFERIWVIQEAVVSREVFVLCGKVAMHQEPLQRIASWLRFLDSRTDVRLLDERAFTYLETLNRCRENIKRRSSWESPPSCGLQLRELLSAFRNCRASDPKDKVFALLGIASDSMFSESDIDYTRSLSEIYTQVAAFYLAVYSTDELLYEKSDKELDDLPSWVPDWSERTSAGKNAAELYRLWPRSDGGSVRDTASRSDRRLLWRIENSDISDWRYLEPQWSSTQNLDRGISLVRSEASTLEKVEEAASKMSAGSEELNELSVWMNDNRALLREHSGAVSHTLSQAAEFTLRVVPVATIEHVFEDLPSSSRSFEELLVWSKSISAIAGQGFVHSRQWAKLSNGDVGLVTRGAKRGDGAYIMGYTPVPLILRQGGNSWRLIGDYVSPSILSGSASHLSDQLCTSGGDGEEDKPHVQTIDLV